ncbi:MAG: flagellar hook basal-body protein [Deltaproteobacteria bacterium]|nr:flagellar hook basal-body protein [Deltaproteobacteria bacterium]
MNRGIYVAAVGAINAARSSDVIANNLAGSSVVGFKKDTPIFSIYQADSNPALYRAASMTPERVFVNISSGNIYTDFEQGLISKTGNPLDFAISGNGFFVIATPDGERYAKRGDFVIDKDGRLKTKDGNNVLGENGVITLTQGGVSVAEDGTISVGGNRIDDIADSVIKLTS